MKTLFFDIDGTIYDESHAKIKAEIQIARRLSEQMGIAYERIWDAYFAGKWAALDCGFEGGPDTIDRVRWYGEMLSHLPLPGVSAGELAEEYWTIACDNIEPYYDFIHFLPSLREQYDICAVTDELPDILRKKLVKLGLEGVFRVAVSSGDAGVLKPDPGIFRMALDRAGVKAGDCLMVGDNPRKDTKGARAVGMRTALFRRGSFYFYDCSADERADFDFTHYGDLLGALERIGFV